MGSWCVHVLPSAKGEMQKSLGNKVGHEGENSLFKESAVVLLDGSQLAWKMRGLPDHTLVPACSHLGGIAFASVLLLSQALFFLVKRFGF